MIMYTSIKTLIACTGLLFSTAAVAQQYRATAPRAAGVPQSARGAVTVNGEQLYREDIKDLKSKEVSQEVIAPKGGEIFLENNNRPIVVKTWAEQKVKVVTTVFFEGEGKLSDEEWFEKLNLSLRTLGNSVKIKSGNVSGGSYTVMGNTYGWNWGGEGVAVFNGQGQNIGTKSNTRRTVTVYVPANSKMDIETRYADIELGDLASLSLDITNGNVDGGNVNELKLRSRYGNASFGNSKYAEVEFTNGRLTLAGVDELDIDSKYATIEVGSSKKITMRSTNDEYELEEVGSLSGRKNYGNLRITKLNTALEMDGTNADIKVRNVGASLENISIDNKYADIRIPLRNVKSYAVDFTGPYSSVYGNFEKTYKVDLVGQPNSSNSNRFGDLKAAEDINNPSRFTAKVGEGGAKLVLKCQNCTVDLK
jgi:hypothetical protein